MSLYFIEGWLANAADVTLASFSFSCWFIFLGGVWGLISTADAYRVRWTSRYDFIQVHILAVMAASASALFVAIEALIPVFLIVVILSVVIATLLPHLSAAGLNFVIAAPLYSMSSFAWGYDWLSAQEYPSSLILALVTLSLLSAIWMMVVAFIEVGTFGLLTRKQWFQPNSPHFSGVGHKRVSVHVPVHAEPPHIVIETLDHIAAIDYDNFEVLVCDNNTMDPALWKPVEAHCQKLNSALGIERFRFFHVEGLTGAKAGALNYCLDRTDPSAELIAIMDADYLCEAGFLSHLVPFFDDPGFGFVQTSHDYRCNDATFFNRACYWDYMPPTRLEHPSASEMGASFTVGTMCVLSKAAIERAGRWAEWCQTEDSEIAIRIRAEGYGGIFLPYSYGRGLMPDNFSDWKKQRFRWTAGPMQQLRRHWRLFLPTRMGGSNNLTAWGKCYEIYRSLAALGITYRLVSNIVFALIYPVCVWLGVIPSLQLPPLVYICFGLLIGYGVIRTVTEYRICGCKKLGNIFAAWFAGLALGHVRGVAAISAALGKEMKWQRTPKFSSHHTVASALSGASTELMLAASLLPIIGIVAYTAQFNPWLDTAVSAFALVNPLLTFTAAPIMALLARRTGQEYFRDDRALRLPSATARNLHRRTDFDTSVHVKVADEV